MVLSELPDWLRVLADGESRPIDEATIVRRLQAAWVTDVRPYPGPGFNGLVLVFDDFPISIDKIWGESSSPVADALDEAVRIAQKWDLLRRLHSAWMDMDQILHAARDSLDAEEASEKTSQPDDRFGGPLREVMETGMVVLYARHFDGERQLPRRWWPRGRRKATHDWLVERRNTVVAHADETTDRQLVTLPTVGPGPPVVAVAEARRGISVDDLREVIHHCEALWRRYSDAVLQLKWDLGIGASGEPFGSDTYDE